MINSENKYLIGLTAKLLIVEIETEKKKRLEVGGVQEREEFDLQLQRGDRVEEEKKKAFVSLEIPL